MKNDLFAGIPTLRLEECSPEKTGLVLSAYIAARVLQKAARRLLERGYHIEDVSALDTADGFLVTHHFDHFETPGRVALRTLVSTESPSIPSISAIFSGASWHERETHDFHGVVFEGLENQTPLLMPPDADFFPLRKNDKAKKAVSDLIEPCQALYEDPGFTLFAAPEPEAAPEKEEKA